MSVDRLLADIGSDDGQHGNIRGYLSHVENVPTFIQEYIRNSAGPTHEFELDILDVYKVERSGCKEKFRSDVNNRRYLWHGTRKENVSSIIRDGFDLSRARPTGMFGPGLYFADCSTKAAQYAHQNGMGYLLLCEIALGEPKSMIGSNRSAQPQKANSIFGRGTYGISEREYMFLGLNWKHARI